jgi:hypothetical protein
MHALASFTYEIGDLGLISTTATAVIVVLPHY